MGVARKYSIVRSEDLTGTLNNYNQMKAQGNTVKEILANIPEERFEAFNKLHNAVSYTHLTLPTSDLV